MSSRRRNVIITLVFLTTIVIFIIITSSSSSLISLQQHNNDDEIDPHRPQKDISSSFEEEHESEQKQQPVALTENSSCLIHGQSEPWKNISLMKKLYLLNDDDDDENKTTISTALKSIAMNLRENMKRCKETRRMSSIPLFPATLDEYHSPYGNCERGNLHLLKYFDFGKAWEGQQDQQQQQLNGSAAAEENRSRKRRPLTPSLESNLKLFYDHHHHQQQQHSGGNDFESWIQEVTSYPIPEDYTANNYNHRHCKIENEKTSTTAINGIQLMPNHSQTLVVNKTRIWEHLLPVTAREAFPTEHERSHAAQLRMLAILVSILEKYNLRNYFISHGSLLGAFRNKNNYGNGIISHDVDIDIAMPASSMNVLRKVWRKEFPRDMMLQSETSDPGFYLWASRVSGIRIKDRYSCNYGVPSVIFAGKKKRIKLRKIHQGFGLDILPLEKRLQGRQYKILSSYFNTSDIYPLSAICLGGVIVPAPRNVTRVLETIYGRDFQNNARKHLLPAHFGGVAAFPYLATSQCRGSIWALNYSKDFGGRAIRRRNGMNGERNCILQPRADPNNG